jgi:CRP-like cAMP-binding protein
MSSYRIEPLQFLRRLPLFADFTDAELAPIAAATTELHIERGTPIFKRGDPCAGFHTVVYGQVKLSFVSAQGNEKIVEIVGPGHSFGEALMFMEKPYILNACALADCMLLHIAKQAVFDELDRSPVFARRMLAGMSRRLHGLISDVEAYTLRSGTQRVIGYLLREEPEDGARITLGVSKKLLASRLNLTPEYFSRVLHELAEQKLLAIAGRDITILNAAGLRAYET